MKKKTASLHGEGQAERRKNGTDEHFEWVAVRTDCGIFARSARGHVRMRGGDDGVWPGRQNCWSGRSVCASSAGTTEYRSGAAAGWCANGRCCADAHVCDEHRRLGEGWEGARRGVQQDSSGNDDG